MAFLSKGRKIDLQILCDELKLEVLPDHKVADLKELILTSDDYDAEFTEKYLDNIIAERVEGEQLKAAEKRAAELAAERAFELDRMRITAGLSGASGTRSVDGMESSTGIRDLKKLIQRFDPKEGDISLWLVLFERQAGHAQIKKEDWVSQLLGLLPYDITQLIAREDAAVAYDYEHIKELLLKRFKLSPETFRMKFFQHRRTEERTWKDFTFELTNYFEEWIGGLKVSTMEGLKDLIIVDQLKRKVPLEVKEHFVDEWGTITSPAALVELLDKYESIRGFRKKTARPDDTASRKGFAGSKNPYEFQGASPKPQSYPQQGQKNRWKTPSENEPRKFSSKVICFSCKSEGHIRRFCPKGTTTVAQIARTETNDSEKKGLNVVSIQLSRASFDFEDSMGETDGELLRIDLGVGCHRCKGIVDSGAEITVLRKSIIPEELLESRGKIMLRPAMGAPVEAKLMTIPLSLWTEEEDINPFVQVEVAVVEGLHEEALITPKVYKLLLEQKEKYLGEGNEVGSEERAEVWTRCNNLEGRSAGPEPSEEVLATPVGINLLPEEIPAESNEESVPPVSQVQKLKKDQMACTTLQDCFAEARQGKNNFWIESELLYHTGEVGGQKYVQLVVPECRRKDILKLAHETPTGGHLAAKKTKDRIAMSFWWNGLLKDVKKFCESCHHCQLRRKSRVKDRAPIEAVGRPELPFQVVNADILGPIDPKSSRGHKYLLCVVDQHSRWPEAIPIKSLTAKATCDAFMEIFMRTGIPRVIAMDNGTNFAANLTREFLKQLGCVPKFSTPGYPQANGLVERWIGTMKSMLHHAITSQGRGWDKQLPFLLWAYREVPNATTGVPPFLLVHGRPPVGPLAILRSSWEEEVVLPQGTGESVTDYLQELRNRLTDAATYAEDIAGVQQQRYVSHHNLRSKDIKFEVGDEVVVLIPDSTNRLCSRWMGPGEIVDKKSPHSFTVKLPDGSVRHLHQNKLRKYTQPIRTIGIIYETDQEFGEIHHAPLEPRIQVNEGLNQLLETDDWNNLSPSRKSELFEVIMKFQSVFDGELKRSRVGVHEIKLKPSVQRKQPHLYKVPEALKPKVERQVAELLEKDLIEPSTAEIVYPIVCVAKKDGTIRLCCDYRGLNAESQLSPFPMQNSEQLRFKAGAAQYLTTLDILKGYWEIPLAEDSRELTSFVSPKGQYQWKVMPFGLSGAPATFQRIMNQILRPHSDFTESFLDDIIIYSNTWTDHLKHIEAVLRTLEEGNFSANLGKCSFAKPKVKYLGHIVGSGEHGPDPEKIAAIQKLKSPTTKKALRSVLGLFNYYREYVPQYANIAKPLTDLTRKAVPNDIPWSSDAEEAFATLKDNLCRVTSLSTPNMDKPFELHTDASLTGIGACLMQNDSCGRPQPITFASQKLTPAQSKWSTIEREAYAVIWALGKFEVWTYGAQVNLYTDHNPLKFLTEGVPKNARLQRWSLALSRYQVNIAHKSGKSNVIADALSRLYE